MAGSFSSKKVARAARTGGGRRRSINTNIGYYALLLIITIIGTSLVVYSRNERLSASSPGDTPPLAPSPDREGDFWFEAYGIYICDNFVPPINSDADPFGFSTRNDGIIYIHPAEKQYAGKSATLGRFAQGVDLQLERNVLKVPGSDTTYTSNESKCGDATGELVVKEWEDVTKPESGEIRKGDPSTILLKDNAAVTIAFVPKGKTDIPIPASAANLAAAKAAAQAGAGTAPVTETVPGPTPSTAAP